MKETVKNRLTGKPVAVPNLDARLTDGERFFRRLLLQRLLEAARPLTMADLVPGSGLDPSECEELARALENKGLLARSAGGEIAFVYPVSALPTSHRVRLADGRSFYAMCAIDALGSAFEFALDATVTSACSRCRQPLTVSLAAGRLQSADPPTIQVLHVDLDNYRDWAANC